MSVNSVTVDGLLKKVYSDKEIENLQNMETETLKRLKTSPKKPAGQGFVFPVNVQGNQRGTGAINELESLRTPASQVPVQGTILPKIESHTIEFSGLSLEIAKGNEESFADNMTFQMDEGLKDTGKDQNGMIFRDGSGKLAQVNGAVVAGTVVTVDHGVITHFRVGEYLDGVNPGLVTQIQGQRITNVDVALNQITFAAPQTIDDNSFLYRENVEVDAPADGKEYAGLKLVTDNGSLLNPYEGINRSTFQQWDGIAFDATGANVSNDLLQRMISRVKVTSGRKPQKVISNTSQFRKYLDVVVPLKRFEDGAKMDSGYTEVPTWNGMEWIEDTDCGFDEIYMYHPDYFLRYTVYKLRFDDSDGKILKWNGKDGFVCYAKEYGNFGSEVPNAHVRIFNLNVPSF